MACSIGAAPRRSGRREGWRLRPPQVARERMRCGIRRPKDTAIMREMGEGGVQPVKLSSWWVSREREEATEAMGTMWCCQFVWTWLV
jgi:hypothetical protein